MQRNPTQLSKVEYDLIVIGGGIYGACIAWDAAQRGLSVAIIERGDFGQETSANSLKTVHGGLRYLQDFDLNMVRLMIQERSIYLHIAPHLVHPLPCLTPTYSRLMKSKAVMGMALKLNDFVGYDRNKSLNSDQEIPSSRIFSREDCQVVMPGLQNVDVTGAALWFDGQIYDTERLTLSFINSAANAGAEVCNYVAAVGLLQQDNKVIGVKARDTITNEDFNIRSRVVVNAAGPWIDGLLEGLNQHSAPRFRHSLAINIITRRIVEDFAVGVPSWPDEKSRDGSNQKISHMLFISPWRNHSIIGTFHSHFPGDPDKFMLEENSLENIILEANSAYPGANLELDDIKFVHHGFLPEKSNPTDQEVTLVRKSGIIDHRSDDGLSGLISIIGVKYTTARHAAEKTVDLVFDHLGKTPLPSKTHSTQLYGGQIDHFDAFLSTAINEDSSLLEPNIIDHWVRSYGTNYELVKKLLPVSEDQSKLSYRPDRAVYAQVIYAVREEMAIKLTDVILRRTGLGSVGRPDDSTLENIAEIMALELGWSTEKKNLEVEEVKAIYRKHGLRDRMVDDLESS